MRKVSLFPVAMTLLAFGCSVKDNANNTNNTQQEQTEINQQIADLPVLEVPNTTIAPILNGDTVAVDLQGNLIQLSLASNSQDQAVISLTDANGVITYFQKESEVIALRKDLQTFLQGVWVAIAQVKNGIHFKLVVDPQNRLTLTLSQTEQGNIQIDIQVQGTPNQEEVAAAEQQFIAWLNQVPQSSVQPYSSAIDIPLSSQGSEHSSSSSLTEWPMSSSYSIIIPTSSSSQTAIPVSSATLVSSAAQSSNSEIAVSSSAISIPSSSSGEVCMIDEYEGYMVEMLLFSWDAFSKTDCNNATTSKSVNGTIHYYRMTHVPASEIDPYAGTMTVYRTNDKGSLMDAAPCTRTIPVDAGGVWGNSDSDVIFRNCMKSL